jgi:type IV pilus assembly protein PilQ
LIESRVVIASDDYAKDLGVRFGFNRGTVFNGGDNFAVVAGGLPGNTAGTFGLAPGIENPPDSGAEALMVNLPVAAPSGAVNLLVGKLGSYLLQLELSAMQTEGKGEIISSPRLITSDQNTATIKQGVEIPYQSTSENFGTTVEFKEAVLMLNVTPHITPDDRILMELHITKDQPDFTRAIAENPPVDTRSVETTVLVDNGETVVLGGVFERTTTENQEKVPFFGDIPYVGFLFKRREYIDSNRELLVFVTPKILKESLGMR